MNKFSKNKGQEISFKIFKITESKQRNVAPIIATGTLLIQPAMPER